MADLYTALLIASAITNIALLYLLLRRPERTPVVISFMLFIVAITVWGVPQIIINWFGLYLFTYEQLDRLSALGYVTIPSIFFVFSLAFTKKLSLLKNVWISLYVFLPAIVFLYLSWTTFLIDDHSQEAIVINQWGYNSQPGEYFAYFLFWLESLMIASIILLIAYYRSVRNPVQHKQIILLIIAVLVPLVLGSVTDGILPLFGIHIFPAAVPFTTFMAIIIGYAILRYELFDFEAQTVLSSIGEGVVTVNRKGEISNVNTVIGEMLRRHPSEITGKKIESVITSSVEHVSSRMLQAIKTGRKFSSSDFVIKFKRKSIPVSVTITPITIKGSVAGATMLVKDIREDKKREESKDEFISVASHELKTPITSIKLYTDILANKISSTSSEYQIVGKLQDQVNRMVSLTNDILDFSRIRIGDLQVNFEVFNVVDLVKEVIEPVQNAHPDRDIQLRVTLKREVYADRARIAQVILNLVSNAVKYSPPSSKITITCMMQDEKALIRVSDNGAGIPKEQQSKIFDKFYRIDGLMSDQTSLGIGLYVSARIIKKHKGKIWVNSRKKGGSTFSFTLPLADSKQKSLR